MHICTSVAETRATLAALRAGGKSVALVPTMGSLHDGHMSLVRLAKTTSDSTVVSIFVNPAQFGQASDLAAYPRNNGRDLAMLKAAGVDLVFLPDVDMIYPEGAETIVETSHLANILHGLVRPGHFRGVSTVVAKLFNIVQPDVAVFGEKDYQQLLVIRRMVRDLHMPVDILGGVTCREADGLAMSSRNTRLSVEDRAAAVVLSKSLELAEHMVRQGTSVEVLKAAVTVFITAEPRASLQAVDICGALDLSPRMGPITAPVALMLSVEFGGILLIDQRVAHPA